MEEILGSAPLHSKRWIESLTEGAGELREITQVEHYNDIVLHHNDIIGDTFQMTSS